MNRLSLPTDQLLTHSDLPGREQSLLMPVHGRAFETELRARAGTDWDIDAVLASYASLPVDQYLPAGATYRRRRFGRFLYAADGSRLAVLPHLAFEQSAEVNSVAGGFKRYFETLDPAVRDACALDLLLRGLIGRLPPLWPLWRVYVHQIRVVSEGLPVAPAPEGIHCDGHDFIAIVALARHNISGGRNSVYDRDRQLLLETTLNERFDLLLLDDRRTLHGVSPVQSPSGQSGYRDMLIIDFNQGELET